MKKFEVIITGDIDKYDVNDMKWNFLEFMEASEGEIIFEIKEIEEK